MYARQIILNPRQPLDYILLEWLRKRMTESNPELYRFVLESVGKKYPDQPGLWDRQIDVAVIGLSLLGAIDDGEYPNNHVRVTPESIFRAKEADRSKMKRMIKKCCPELSSLFEDAFDYAFIANDELNKEYGSSIKSERMMQGVVIFFDAYWQELRE